MTISYPTSLTDTLYAVLIGTDGSYYNADADAMQAYAGSNWANYAVGAGTPSSGTWSADVPAAVATLNGFDGKLFIQAGAGPATDDVNVAAGMLVDVPTESQVLDDVTFGTSTGNVVLPPASNVATTDPGFGAGGATEGTLRIEADNPGPAIGLMDAE